MKKIVLGIVLCCYALSYARVDLKINSKKRGAQSVLLWCIQENDEYMPQLVEAMERALSFTKQCYIQVEHHTTIPSKEDLKALKRDKKAQLVITIAPFSKGYEWRLYDTIAPTLHAARRYEKRGDLVRGWAYNICDDVWDIMMHSKGFFSTKIAYAQKVPDKRIKHIYVADFDGSYPQKVVDTSTINVAPRWHYDRKHPMLFYSDFTAQNIRLMVMGMDGVSKIASNFDGVNMIPAFSGDGSKMAYCSSRGDGYCQIYYCEKNEIKNITNNTGNNVSPSMTSDGSKIFYCSDVLKKSPELFCYNFKTGSTERLTSGAHCETPRYSPACHKVAYVRSVKGIMQLFVFDLVDRSHTQLTFAGKHKQECCWSPCGNWLIFSEGDLGKESRIALLNLHDKTQRMLTPAGHDCTFPDWSPIYSEYPQFLRA